MIEFDGHTYESISDVPDLGSWSCTDYKGSIRDYQGLSSDVSKLPKYTDLKTGSSAMCVDTGDLYLYEATTKTWYLQ